MRVWVALLLDRQTSDIAKVAYFKMLSTSECHPISQMGHAESLSSV